MADSFAELAFPQYVAMTSRITAITNFAELPIILWLLIWGARPKPQPQGDVSRAG